MIEVKGLNRKMRFIESFKDVSLIVSDTQLKTNIKQVLVAKTTENLKLISYVTKNTRQDSLVVFCIENAILAEKLIPVIKFLNETRFVVLIRK